MNANTESAELTLKSQHGGSVRFDAPKDNPQQKPPVVSNVYVNRSFAAINNATRIRVTVEVLE